MENFVNEYEPRGGWLKFQQRKEAREAVMRFLWCLAGAAAFIAYVYVEVM